VRTPVADVEAVVLSDAVLGPLVEALVEAVLEILAETVPAGVMEAVADCEGVSLELVKLFVSVLLKLPVGDSVWVSDTLEVAVCVGMSLGVMLEDEVAVQVTLGVSLGDEVIEVVGDKVGEVVAVTEVVSLRERVSPSSQMYPLGPGQVVERS
jgi:hypothetical protein